MKVDSIPFSVAFNVASGLALAQGASDPMEHLRACSLMEHAERLECLDKLSRNIAPPARPAPDSDNWIVSETTSPVDYMPIVTATTFSRGGSDRSSMQLSIHCRGSRTELVVAGPAVPRGSVDYVISYRINDGQPVQLAAGPARRCGKQETSNPLVVDGPDWTAWPCGSMDRADSVAFSPKLTKAMKLIRKARTPLVAIGRLRTMPPVRFHAGREQQDQHPAQ
jgi:hypothetical protein